MSPVQPTTAGVVGRTSGAGRFRPAAWHAPVLGAGLLLMALTACSGSGGSSAVVAAAPAFSTQPADATALVGGTATFTAAASGAPTYQWTRNGVAIAGATSTSYTTPLLSAADNNAVYAVTAQNSGGAVTSSYATLHVNYATLTTHPFNVTVAPGQAAGLSVSASGSGTLSYQWAKGGVAVPGATGATLSFPSPVLADSGSYTCTVTSSLNGTSASATSNAGTLAVITGLPVITSAPADVTVVSGQSATFTVAATDALGYQWLKNGLPLAGATAASYTVPVAIGGDDNAAYTCTVSNPAGSTTSPAAHLRVNYVRIATQPANTVLAQGSTLTLAPGLAASGTLTCQWSKDGVALAGATAPSYVVPNVGVAAEGLYSCTYTSTLNGTTVQATSDLAQVQVVALPIITTQPVGATSIVGSPLTLKVAATQAGTGNLTYQWFRGTTALQDVTSGGYGTSHGVTGTRGTDLYLQSLQATDDGIYTCQVTNTYRGVAATVTSAPATVVVNSSPIITGQPANATVYAGRPATFTVTAQGPGTLTYTWYRGGTAIPNSNSSTYTIPATLQMDSGATFHCVVSNGTLPDAVSQNATLTVNALPAGPSLQASSELITLGQGVVFTYLFDPTATGTFGPQGGAATPVTSGGATTVYPGATTTYVLSVTSGGTTTTHPVTVTVKTYTPKFLYVVNQDDNNLWQYPVNADSPRTISGVGFMVYDYGKDDPTKALVGLPLTLHRSTGSKPTHVAATWDEKFVYVANLGDATLSAYTVNGTNGNLMPVTGSPFTLPGGYTKPWCSVPDPTASRLYVGCAEGIAVFTIDGATGALTAAPALCYAIPGRVQGDLLMHPSGKFLYVGDSGHSVIKAFAIDGTGALTPTGSDMPVTYASGRNPTYAVDVQNASNLTFDRSAGVIFTTSNDPLVFQHGTGVQDYNGAIDSFQVDPYTGALTRLATSRTGLIPPQNYWFLVNGYQEGDHALVYSAQPGLDQLTRTYANGLYGDYMSTLAIDLDPASATFGQSPGYFVDPNFSAQYGGPHGIGSSALSVRVAGSNSLVQDRSGRIRVPILGIGNQDLIAWGCDATGSQAFMGSGLGEQSRSTGLKPVHGIILGSLN